MKKIIASILCFVMVAGLFLTPTFAAERKLSAGTEQSKIIGASVKPYYSANTTSDKIVFGDKTFFSMSSYGGHYHIYMSQEGARKPRTIATEAAAAFVTNGTYLFYAKHGAAVYSRGFGTRYKQTIYRINVNTGKKKKIASGTALTPLACSGSTWLYAGVNNVYEGYKLYAVNIKTGKKKLMMNSAGHVQYVSGVVLAEIHRGDAGNYPFYVFNKNGSGKKKIASALRANIRGKYIYYVVYKYSTDKYKVYRSSLKGKNKKAVTKWLNFYPESYFT